MDRRVPPEHRPAGPPKSIRPELDREHDVAAFVGVTVAKFWRLPDNEQDIWRKRFQQHVGKCLHCGNQREDCSDPDRDWYPQLTVCYATRERIAAQRRWESLHKDAMYHDGDFQDWAPNASLASPYHLLDGATVWVSQMDLRQGGDFLRQSTPGDEDDE